MFWGGACGVGEGVVGVVGDVVVSYGMVGVSRRFLWCFLYRFFFRVEVELVGLCVGVIFLFVPLVDL